MVHTRRLIAFLWPAILIVGMAIGTANEHPPQPAVVTGPQAPELERYAADQLCGYLAKLFKMQVRPSSRIPSDADALFLVGNSDTNPLVKEASTAGAFPKLSDQGIVLRRAHLGKRPVLIVGGGSPRATLWAVYELVERWGVRYLLHDDVLPKNIGPFSLPDINLVLEPTLRVRQWRVVNEFPIGPASWGMADYRPFIDQLAKLKFNRLLVATWAHEPFLDYEVGGIKRRSATMFFGYRFPITDDMIGRPLFGNVPEFWPRDLPLHASYEELTRAGIHFIHSLMAYGRERGMQSVITAPIADFPPEFAPLIKGAQKIHQLGGSTIVPGPQTPVDDPGLAEMASTVLRATVNTYPEADYVEIGMPEFRQWASFYEQAWRALDAKYGISTKLSLTDALAAAPRRKGSSNEPERSVQEVKGDIVSLLFYDRLLRERRVLKDTRRPDMPIVYSQIAEELFPVLPRIMPKGWETLNGIDYNPARIARRAEVLGTLPARELTAMLIFTLHDDNTGIVPQTEMGPLAELTKALIHYDWAGYSTRYWLIGDHDPVAAFLSRASWDATATAEDVARDQFRAICGQGCVEDMLTVFKQVEEATKIFEWKDMSLAFPVPDMMMKQWKAEPMPEDLLEARQHYVLALAAARQAQANARLQSRDDVDYWVGRLEFGIGYLDTVAAVKRAATAEAEKNRQEAVAQAETALQTVRRAIEAFVQVARDRSDVGTIAVLNEYAYRPLREKVAELKKTAQ